MSLNGVITAFATGTYTVTRTASAAYVAGVMQTGAETTFSIVACVQPSTGRSLDSPPEHDRTSESRTLWTETELRTRTPTTEPDSVEIEGESWSVTNVRAWPGFPGEAGHYEVTLERDDIG